MAVEYKGCRCYGRCIDALEFHHADSSGKDFSISEKGYTRRWSEVKEELDKCVLLYANRYQALHARVAASTGNRS